MKDDFESIYEELKKLPKSKREKLRQIIINYGELTKENKETFIRFYNLLYEMQGLPVEAQQELIDNIQDEKILEFLEEQKKSLS